MRSFFVSWLGCLWNTTKKNKSYVPPKARTRKIAMHIIVKETYFIVLFILYVHKATRFAPFFFQPCAPLCARPCTFFPFFLFCSFFVDHFWVLKKTSICTHQSNHRILPVPRKSVGSLSLSSAPLRSLLWSEGRLSALRLRCGRTSPSLPVARKAGLNLWLVGDNLWYIFIYTFGALLCATLLSIEKISSLRAEPGLPGRWSASWATEDTDLVVS